MLVLNYVLLFVIVILLSMLLQRYYDVKDRREMKDTSQNIQQYLHLKIKKNY